MYRSPIGKKILEFEQLASTNSKAKELIKDQDICEGTVIKTMNQYSGRGYAFNTWESETGKNVTASWILKPEFLSPQHQFRLTQMLSLAVKDTVDNYLPPDLASSVKWPNDIYVGNKKIAGILVENSIMADKIKTAVCGIGLNINQERFVSDPPNPVSMYQITGKTYDINEVIETLSAKISYWYNCLRAEHNELLLNAYHKALFRMNTRADFRTGEEKFEGTIKGTDPWGRLIIETARGETRLFEFKEVAFVL